MEKRTGQIVEKVVMMRRADMRGKLTMDFKKDLVVIHSSVEYRSFERASEAMV